MRTSKHGLSFLLVFVLGCSSLTPERVNILAQIAGQAAQIGAQQWLAKHPEHRLAFEAVIASIQALVKAGVTNQTAYAELLQSLPTATLAGPSGELYVTEDRLVIWDAELKKAVAVRGAAEQPVIRATVSGLKRAMLPLPPVPVKAKARRVTPTNQVFIHNPPKPLVAVPVSVVPVSQAQSSAAPALQLLGRTNVTRSVVDVTHSEGAASMVSVRWHLGPRSVYHVERQEGESWRRFISVTNATGTGLTNWCTVWNPSLPLGSWRVLRVR